MKLVFLLIMIGIILMIIYGCCHCPSPYVIMDNPYSQENLRQEAREIEQVELQKQ